MKRTKLNRGTSVLKSKTKLRKKSLMPLPRLKKKAWSMWSEIVRRRDNYVCFTCDAQGDKHTTNAGHYIHKDCLDFDEININCQCIRCNKHLSGNSGIYAERLIKKYGMEAVEELRQRSYQVRKFNRAELEYMIGNFKLILETMKGME